jgi:hypothetical protein
MDGIHFPILHQDTGGRRWPEAKRANTTRGYVDQFVSLDYWEEPWGIMRKAVYRNGNTEDDALIFPTSSSHRRVDQDPDR